MGSASRLAGLYDAAEEAKLRHGLAAAGLVATTEPGPAQLDWMREAVLRRFLGVRSRRKARYAALLVEALELGQVPEPSALVLARI